VRARLYASRANRWLEALEYESPDTSDDPRDVISWFHFFVAPKIHRSLAVWADEDADDDIGQDDRDGSAKIALLGIEASHAAWLELVERGRITSSEANSFLADLVWLGDALERVRPKARAFVRPGLDEPEAVAILLAAE
jgi:hypothetical protein